MMISPEAISTVAHPSPEPRLTDLLSVNSLGESEIDSNISDVQSATSQPSSAPSATSSTVLTYVKPEPPSAPGAIPLPVPSTPIPEKSGTSGELFTKRGSGKRKTGAALDEALNIMREMAKEPDVPIPVADTADHFGAFIASRLRTMEEIARKQCEDQLMAVLMKF